MRFGLRQGVNTVLREQIDSIEASLRQVAGILSARIRTDQDEISEVHVIAAPNRRAKGVVRDVVTTLFARHGIDLHHHKVSVATTADRPAGPSGNGFEPGRRLLFRSVNIYREGNRNEAQVELQDGERVLTGVASGPAVRQSQERLVVQATMLAVSRLFGGDVQLDLSAVERTQVGSHPVLLCHIILLRGRTEVPLLGSTLMRGDPLEAAVFSVLDALNRVLPMLTGDDSIEYEVEENSTDGNP